MDEFLFPITFLKLDSLSAYIFPNKHTFILQKVSCVQYKQPKVKQGNIIKESEISKSRDCVLISHCELKKNYRSMFNLQCCATFRYTMKNQLYIYTHYIVDNIRIDS